ncbi:heme peroxidase [Panaeolus papilionaceus]|nr:heme peroxidase [Panaeolus papilionaceus]
MSTLMRRLSRRIDYNAQMNAPLDTDGATPQTGLFEKKMQEIQDLISKPAFSVSDLGPNGAVWDAIRNASFVGLDDRKLLLEKLIVVMSSLQGTDFAKKLQQFLLTLLYKDLPHPPSSYLATQAYPPPLEPLLEQGRVKYAYHTADGSRNNPLMPTLGQAGTPYARSVSTSRIAPKAALPDPGLVFDTLLRRPDGKFKEHPGGISALFFAFADLVIHSIFNTNHTDWTINDSSSYLDLSILYGSNQNQVNSVRKLDGTGQLWDDVFADSRLLLMPPASCALLVLMNRNHNYIAQRILDINENGNLASPPPTDAAAKKQQDDEIFHRARLVNCGYFMHIILGDYVGAILGLVRDGTDWRLDPLMTMREIDHDFVPVGQGNVVSVEFNLLYRWHATLSEKDTTWTNDLFQKVFPDKQVADLTISEFKVGAHANLIPPADKRKWTFNGLKRGSDGRFNDDELAKILLDSTEARAGAFGARGTPEVLRVIEIMGIQQSRSWGTCSLNEFRKFIGLKPYGSFKEWNPDPEIHTAAAALYKDIENLELHVGLQAEETKAPGPGAGLCPGYTISRAILADAVCLTRGDRFLTSEFNPYNLSSWGYQDCQYDKEDGSFGGLLTKLLFRTLPEHYQRGSAYAHFPFMEPKFMKANLEKNFPGQAEKYSWTRPRRTSSIVAIDSHAGVEKVLRDNGTYMTAYDQRLFATVQSMVTKRWSKDTLQSEDKKRVALDKAKQTLMEGVKTISQNIFSKPEPKFAEFFASKTEGLIKAKSFEHVGSKVQYVDIVRDVVNLVPLHWICQEIAGLPLKTRSNRHGAWYEQITYDKWADVANYVYLNTDPVDDWKLRERSQKNASEVMEFMKEHIDKIDSWMPSISDSRNHQGVEGSDPHAFLKKLWATAGKGSSRKEFTAALFAALIPSAALYSQAVSHIINFYLDDDKKVAREEIVKLAASSGADASAKIEAYILEALRLDPPVTGVYRTAAKDDVLAGVEVKAGQTVFASITQANTDLAAYGATASSFDVTRSPKVSPLIDFGEHGLMTSEFFKATAPAIVAKVLSLKDVQRGPGRSGTFTRFSEEWHGAPKTAYINLKGMICPWPDALMIQYSSA